MYCGMCGRGVVTAAVRGADVGLIFGVTPASAEVVPALTDNVILHQCATTSARQRQSHLTWTELDRTL